MKKRIFLAALMLVLVMGMGTALAGTAIGTIDTGETIYEEGDWWYYYSPDGTSVTLFQYNNDSETTIVFPEELDGKPVTAALPQAVSSGFTSVTVPASFHTVPEHMFQNKTALQTVVLSDGITGIGQYAFFGCSARTAAIRSSEAPDPAYTLSGRIPSVSAIRFRKESCVYSG